MWVGGIAGMVGSTSQTFVTISDCYTTCTVSNNSSSSGGIAGHNYGTVENCYATGAISGTNNVGGIVGFSSGTVSNCAALNPSVNKEGSGGGTDFGRVAGCNEGTLGVNRAYENMTTTYPSGFGTIGIGTINGANITAAYAKTSACYTDVGMEWNFTTIWKMGTAPYNLPVLQWQTTMPAMPEHLITP